MFMLFLLSVKKLFYKLLRAVHKVSHNTAPLKPKGLRGFPKGLTAEPCLFHVHIVAVLNLDGITIAQTIHSLH